MTLRRFQFADDFRTEMRFHDFESCVLRTEPQRRLIRVKSTGITVFGEIQNHWKTRHAGRSHEVSDPKTINWSSVELTRENALDDFASGDFTKEMGLHDFESCVLRTEPKAVLTTCSDGSPTPQNPSPGGR